MQSRRSFFTFAGVVVWVAQSCNPPNTLSRIGLMCCAKAASDGSIASAASLIQLIFKLGSTTRSLDSCCASDSKTPWLRPTGEAPKIAPRERSARSHTQATISTEESPNALVNAPSMSPAVTSASSAIVGSMCDSRSAKLEGAPAPAPDETKSPDIKSSAAARTSSLAARNECTSGPTSAATAFSFCVYNSAASSSIPRSNTDFTCWNISFVAFSNLGTTVAAIALASAAGSALATASSLSPPALPLDAASAAAIKGTVFPSSFFRIFSIATGRSLVIAALTAVSSCFWRSRSAASRDALSSRASAALTAKKPAMSL
mmetsp:Transcript_13012/g.48685  ORF Transcript_13012/g.48685 Transcript_13012/m.48685 type:complete len:317 (-) Transcript_13012:2426-3376(-)